MLGIAAMLSLTTACSSDDDNLKGSTDSFLTALKGNVEKYGTHNTEAKVSTRAMGYEEDYNAETQTTAYFFIRLDGEAITDHGVVSSAYYYPQDSYGASIFDTMNEGKIELDLTKTPLAAKGITEWNHWSEHVPQYIYSSDGTATSAVITEYPDLSQWEINGKKIDTDKYHVIWYIVKYQYDGWHVDGILTPKEQTEIPEEVKAEEGAMEDITDIPVAPIVPEEGAAQKGEVEFDIHQQVHEAWNEIKTSIHLRDTVNVRVFLPIPGEYIAAADDFDIRAGVDYKYLTEVLNPTFNVGDEEYTVQIVINHKEDGIEILIEGSTCAEALKKARELYDDGITFEINSYIYNIVDNATVWEWLKKTECVQTRFEGWPASGDHCTLTYGQVTSAFYADGIDYYKEP